MIVVIFLKLVFKNYLILQLKIVSKLLIYKFQFNIGYDYRI